MYKMYNKMRKFVFSVSFVLTLFLTNWQNIQIVRCSGSDSVDLLPFDLILKQSDTCGQLDIIPSDIRTFAPWSVAIYRLSGKNKWEFHTGGTIVGPGLVLSVQVGQQGRFPSDKNPRNFFIAAGINDTDFNSHDQLAQYSRVSLVEPLITDQNIYVHLVVYHLEQPLDVVKSPVVGELCFPFFSKSTQFLSNLAEARRNSKSLLTEYIQFGFALPPTLKSISTSTSTSGSKQDRKLKLWKGITLSKENCESIFRFYYGKSSFVPACFRRNTENIRGFVPLPKILDELKVSDLKLTDEDELGCLGPGSGTMYSYGNSWFISFPVFLVPSIKKLRCSSKTVYFGGGYTREQVQYVIRFFYNIYKCPPGQFSCKNPQKCIKIQQTCDQKSDCYDSSDEDPILCGWKMRLKNPNPNKGFQVQSKIERKLNDNSNLTIEQRDLNNRCPSLSFTTEGVRCRDLNKLEVLDCKTPFYSGREIVVDCDDYHTAPEFATQSKNIFCNFDGEWEGLESTSIVCHKKCGIHKPEAGSGFLWDAAIFLYSVHACGGSLIQDNFILSHANCVQQWIEFPRKRSDFHVFIRPLSSNYRENLRSNFTHKTRIKDVWISVNDLGDKYESGIALIKLEMPVLINKNDSPMAVCLLIPPFSKVAPEEIGKISTTYQQEQNTRNFKVVPETECDKILKGQSLNTKNEICATLNQTSTETQEISENKMTILQGSGLNFVQEPETETGAENSGFALLGIASKIEDSRAVFLEVNAFSDWIVDILEANS